MNILHLKYAVEVARLGSLSKASETLLTAQPNISRAIKDLEADLGFSLFLRSKSGMTLTPEGEDFIGYARDILLRLDQVEQLYKNGTTKKKRFSISAPRDSYISEAIAEFSCTMDGQLWELHYREANAQDTIRAVLNNDCKLGIIRYAAQHDTYFKTTLEEKRLNYEWIAEFTYELLMNRDHPLASQTEIRLDDLRPYIEVAHTDSYVPPIPAKAEKDTMPAPLDRRIFINERAARLDILAANSKAFMWASSASSDLLERYGLIRRVCAENHRIYKDVLIYREGHRLTETDHRFITAICESKRKCFDS